MRTFFKPGGFRAGLLFGVVLALLLTGSGARATYYSAFETGTFGNLSQLDPQVTFAANVQSNACVPTSVANGLIWLDNEYGIPNLIIGNGYPTVNQLITDMGTTAAGTYFTNEVTGLAKYIGPNGQDVSPPTFIAGGQVSGGVAGFPQIQSSLPTALYLYSALQSNQAVEFWIGWDTLAEVNNQSFTNGAHSLTLTGIGYDDVAKTGTVSFVDPWGGVTFNDAHFQTSTNGYLFINGNFSEDPNDPDNPQNYSTGALITALAEVPEPSTLALVAIAATGLGAWRLGRKRRASA